MSNDQPTKLKLTSILRPSYNPRTLSVTREDREEMTVLPESNTEKTFVGEQTQHRLSSHYQENSNDPSLLSSPKRAIRNGK